MDRRRFLRDAAAASLLPPLGSRLLTPAWAETSTSAPRTRVRPGDSGWPAASAWDRLNAHVGGRLEKLTDPLAACRADPSGKACGDLFAQIRNPFFIRDHAELTQSLGWADAWISRPSAYAVAARNAHDVVTAVNFAREHQLRLVVKGGGHSYQGTSDAPDSLLVWTRHMDDVELHDAFIPQGCAGRIAPQAAVSVGAGCIWGHVYNAVTSVAGRYVQGGGCMTVGVAGLISSGGFGSWSKRYGLAAAGLIEAEVVTADGMLRIVNACEDPELFWALKGGGGGSLGVITRLTLRTRELPESFGAVNATVVADSDAAYRRLIERFLGHYRDELFNPHWGETVHLHARNTLRISMAFQGLDKSQADAAWRPFFEFIQASPDYRVTAPLQVLTIPARMIWNPEALRRVPGAVVADTRPNAPIDNIVWAGDADQSGQFIHGYGSAWLPAALIQANRREHLVDALFAVSRDWGVALHFNKGLAGAPAAEIEAARDTAMNPQVLDAFALAITGESGPPAYPGIPGHEPDWKAARRAARATRHAMQTLLEAAPGAGSYVSESDYFQSAWQTAFWGPNYPRLARIKQEYDPDGLFFVRHGVGSEAWSDDGFTRSA